ncbi:MAG: hypothetical protein ACC645_02250 [Pirellulales bacterium]
MRNTRIARRPIAACLGCLLFLATLTSHGAEPVDAKTAAESFERAAQSARLAGYALSKVQRWLREVALPSQDPETKLLKMRGVWNYSNTAADCYPFLCWAAYVTDLEALNGPLRDVLHAERKLCNHLDRIPAPYDFEKGAKVSDPSMDTLMFGASEYVKDGLIAIVEITGKDEWFERMVAIEEDMWKHAHIDTPFGKIPSDTRPVRDVEVDGEQLQALVRLYAMTGDRKFLIWAERLGDYYFKRGGFVPPHLRDHGCEIVGGLGLLLGIESEIGSPKFREYLPAMKHMLDEILARGTNPDGFMYNSIQGVKSPFKPGSLSDGWGYNYVGFLCYDIAVGEPHYRSRVEKTLRNLGKGQYMEGGVAGTGGDSLADSAEGAIYLLNRVNVPEGFLWLDRWMDRGLVRSDVPLDKARLWGANKWESNCVRTVIMHALMHTQGIIARPWRPDMQLGAVPLREGVAVFLRTGKPWKGTLVFDVPRHREYLGFKKDWPRMNTLPEWFTVEARRRYAVADQENNPSQPLSGQDLRDGIPVEVKPGEPLRLTVLPIP